MPILRCRLGALVATDVDILVRKYLNKLIHHILAELDHGRIGHIENYIDYSQWSGSSEPKSMGGPITLETMYNVKPSTSSDPKLLPYYYGVQCNLWTEYIAEPEHVEYNSLPPLTDDPVMAGLTDPSGTALHTMAKRDGSEGFGSKVQNCH